MKESGREDLKALRKDHMLPMNGQPRSPGGRLNRFEPNRKVSWIHRFAFFNTQIVAATATSAAASTAVYILGEEKEMDRSGGRLWVDIYNGGSFLDCRFVNWSLILSTLFVQIAKGTIYIYIYTFNFSISF